MEEGYTCMNGSRQSGNVTLSTSPSHGLVATYNNQPSSSYLTPVSPTPTQASQPPAFPASFGQAISQLPRGRHKYPSFPRADSGIESDSPRSPTSATPSPTATANPHGSTLYEYIDPKDVRVEAEAQEITGDFSSQGETTSSGISSETMPYSGDIGSYIEGGTNSGLRRRVNPMYEALEQSATRLYAQTCHCKTQSSAHKQLRYLWCAFIILIILVVFLLCILAYILFHLVPDLKGNANDQRDRVLLLETGYEKLTRENEELIQLFTANKSTSDGPLAASVIHTISHLNSSVGTLRTQLQEVRADLQQQVSNISLTPGPQGPPGVGNLSMCYYTSTTAFMALPGPYSTTSWEPSMEILRDNIVMSATCAVTGGTEHFVEAKEANPSVVQFRCRCDGDVDGYDRRACKIHLVLCPRLSGQNTTVAP